jgi:hypothetical protein
MALGSIEQLAACAALLAGRTAALTPSEQRWLKGVPQPDRRLAQAYRGQIRGGGDPLGEAYTRLRSVEARRASGAVYTPPEIVGSMVEWAGRQCEPARVVDPGTGSGRFLIAAAERFPNASLVAVEVDPVAVLLLRANAAVREFAHRLTINLADYRHVGLPDIQGPTLFIGNPPYVRHHDISQSAKVWFARAAARYGLKASQLAGLHVHFFLKTRELVRRGDYGAFITSAEWLDVNYGAVLRALLGNGLGGTAIHILAPEAVPFADALTTGAITCFRVGARSPHLVVRKVARLADLNGLPENSQDAVPWSALERARKWTAVVRHASKPPAGFVELGELVRVHRGQVTGANGVWIAGAYPGLLPKRVLVPAITRARELLAAGEVLRSTRGLRNVIDLPESLVSLLEEERELVERFLAWARRQGAHESYIARHRTPWWAVRLRSPAPILCTYMARRPPAFVRNACEARHLNIAHGLYPRRLLAEPILMALVRHLNGNVAVAAGRTYAGGLTKFEPKELERVPVPGLEMLYATAEAVDAGRVEDGRDRRRGGVSSSAT